MRQWNLAWSKKHNNGSLLLEVSLVVLLFSILAGLVTFNVGFLHNMVLRSEVEKLYTICRYLQQKAMTCNKEFTLIFDPEHKIYTYDNAHEQLPAHIDFGFFPGAHGPPSAPTKLLHTAVTFPGKRIVFYPSGIIQPGTVYLVDKNKEYMYALSCPVSVISYIRKYTYNGSWQLLS